MATHSPSHQFELPVGKTMLDVVMYAASLVSKSNDIDTQLDRVRSITARRALDQLTDSDNRALKEVYDYIEDYLVTKESLRAFTRESVRDKVRKYLEGDKTRSNLGKPLTVMWAIAISGALAAIIAPEAVVPATVKPTLAITMFFVTINLGAAWMFWTGLRNFKDKIRRAYLPICLGVALVGLTLLQAPIAVLLGQDTSIWFHYVTSGITIPVAETLLYIGMRRFAQIGGIHSRLTSLKLVVALCVSSVVIVILAPKPDTGVPDWALTTSLSILTTGAVLATVTASITAAVRKALSSAYKQPMMWFLITLVLTAASCVQYGVLQLIATAEQPYYPQVVALLALVASALVVLKAGTSFRRIDTASSAIHG